MAHETLTLMATGYWRPNLVPTHNRGAVFNVDIAGGLPAVVAAMLVGSRQARPDEPGLLHLLPAVPAAWPTGCVRGLVARNAVTVRRSAWTPVGVEAVLHSAVPQVLDVAVAGCRRDPVRLEPVARFG